MMPIFLCLPLSTLTLLRGQAMVQQYDCSIVICDQEVTGLSHRTSPFWVQGKVHTPDHSWALQWWEVSCTVSSFYFVSFNEEYIFVFSTLNNWLLVISITWNIIGLKLDDYNSDSNIFFHNIIFVLFILVFIGNWVG